MPDDELTVPQENEVLGFARSLLNAAGADPIDAATDSLADAIEAHEKLKLQKFLEDVAEKVNELRDEVDDQEALSEDEIVRLIYDSRAILMSSRFEEKQEWLKNAFVSSFTSDLSENMRHMFRSYIDDLTPDHVLLLRVGKNPGAYQPEDETWSSIGQEMEATMEELSQAEHLTNETYREKLLTDLNTRGLANWDSSRTGTMTTGGRERIDFTTGYGEEFLRFILRDED